MLGAVDRAATEDAIDQPEETPPVRRYGVKEQTPSRDAVDQAIESLGLLGFAVVDGGYGAAELDRFAEHFDRAHAALVARYGLDALREIDEHNTIRAPLTIDPLFATAPVGLGSWDRELRYVRVNRALAEMNGLSPEEHVGRRLEEVVPGLDQLVDIYRRVVATGAHAE